MNRDSGIRENRVRAVESGAWGSGRGIRIQDKGIGNENRPAPGGKMPYLGAKSHLASGPNPNPLVASLLHDSEDRDCSCLQQPHPLLVQEKCQCGS